MASPLRVRINPPPSVFTWLVLTPDQRVLQRAVLEVDAPYLRSDVQSGRTGTRHLQKDPSFAVAQ